MEEVDKNANSFLGYLYSLISVFAFSLSTIIGKIIFTNNPNLQVTEFLVIRSFTQFIIIVIIVNKDLKKYMFDTIQKKHYNKLIFRVVVILFATYCNFSSIKNLSLIINGLVKNTGPLFTALLSYYFLNEGISTIEVLCLIGAFSGVSYMIIGSSSD
jgi:drug/metabolite transporter (DMT)-like permease